MAARSATESAPLRISRRLLHLFRSAGNLRGFAGRRAIVLHINACWPRVIHPGEPAATNHWFDTLGVPVGERVPAEEGIA